MNLFIRSDAGAPPIWNHFLLGDLRVRIKWTNNANRIAEEIVIRDATGFTWAIPDTTVAFDLIVESTIRLNGREYPLLRIVQTFGTTIDAGKVKSFNPMRWRKGPPDSAAGIARGAPPLHPLLGCDPDQGIVTLALAFVDITQLFNDLHGNTPWFRALDILKGTDRTIRVLASLRGHPLVWYVLVPQSACAQDALDPLVLYFPADYGGFPYENSLAGLRSTLHDTSVDNQQCGGETLVSFLTKPLSDEDCDAKLDAFVAMRQKFKRRSGRNPPPLHHYRPVLGYHADSGSLVPNYWDIPFGFETACFDHPMCQDTFRCSWNLKT